MVERDPGLRQLEARLARRERELFAARRVSEELSRHGTVDELIGRALHISLEVVNARAGSVLLAEPITRQLVFRRSIGESPVPSGTAIPWERGIAGAVFHSGEPQIVRDVEHDQQHFQGIDRLTGYRTRNMIALPLKSWGGQPIGVLEVLNKVDAALDEDDLAILTIISALSATAIDQARLHEEARMAELARRLGEIGHDIKSLLMPVFAGIDLLKADFESAEARALPQATRAGREEALSVLRGGIELVHQRAKDLADAVKGVGMPLELAPCDVHEVAHAVLEALRAVATRRGVALKLDRLEALPRIHADKARLHGALYNLVDNALPEVSSGGQVTIGGERDLPGDGLFLWVADTGRGMPREVRENLFTGRAKTTKIGGTGLGTRIVRAVVLEHGGHLTVDSEEGRGTRVTLWLPCQGPRQPVTGAR